MTAKNFISDKKNPITDPKKRKLQDSQEITTLKPFTISPKPECGPTIKNKQASFLYCIRLSVSFHKLGRGSEESNLKNFVFRLPLHSPFTIFVASQANDLQKKQKTIISKNQS